LGLVIRSGSKAYRLGFGLPWGWGAAEAALWIALASFLEDVTQV